ASCNRFEDMLDDGRVEPFLAAEVIGNQRLISAGLVSNRLRRRGVKTVAAEDARRCLEQRGARAFTTDRRAARGSRHDADFNCSLNSVNRTFNSCRYLSVCRARRQMP